MAGCSQPGPARTVTVPIYQPQPANVDIINASFSPTYPSVGQGGVATLTLRNSGGQGTDVVISGKVFRAGTNCPVEGYFQQVSAYVPAGQTVTVSVPYSGTFVSASWIDWEANANTCYQAGTNYGWLDCYFGIDYYPNQEKHYTLQNAIRLPD
jgi:hypothetical protein